MSYSLAVVLLGAVLAYGQSDIVDMDQATNAFTDPDLDVSAVVMAPGPGVGEVFAGCAKFGDAFTEENTVEFTESKLHVAGGGQNLDLQPTLEFGFDAAASASAQPNRALLQVIPGRGVTKGWVELPAGLTLKWTCLRTTGTCDVFVTVLHCPPCTTANNGGLPTQLPLDGFRAGSCSPRIVIDGDKLKAVTFFKQLAPTEVLEVTLSKPARFIHVRRSPGVDCSTFGDEFTCKAAANVRGEKKCAWSGSTCESSWCPAKPSTNNPGTPCDCSKYTFP